MAKKDANREEYLRWLTQAKHDLSTAKVTAKGGSHDGPVSCPSKRRKKLSTATSTRKATVPLLDTRFWDFYKDAHTMIDLFARSKG